MADKSQLIQHLMGTSDRWQTLAEIKAAVPSIPDRTLRRWLSGLAQQGSVQRTGEHKGRRYRWLAPSPAGSTSVTFTSEIPVFTQESLRLLERADAPLYTRPPST